MASRPQADTQGFQWKLRRMVDNIIHFATARTTKVYPKTTGALQSLREAVNEEMPVKRRRIALDNPGSRKRKSPGTLAEVTSRRHYQKMRRVEKINKELLIKIASHTAARTAHTKHNYIAPDWLVRVFLSTPSSNSRGLEKSFREVVGMDAPSISRRSMSRVRDTWVEFYVPMVLKVAADRLAAAMAGAIRSRVNIVPFYCVHVQDEAAMKLRSKRDDGVAVPRRSRACKVQQNVLHIHDMYGSVDIPTELEALNDKTSATLATSFERLVRYVATSILPATCGGALPATRGGTLPASRGGASSSTSRPAAHPTPEFWMFHVLVGDGIATNEAAAKRLWACFQERGIGQLVRYLLVVVICGTHQAGLAAKSAIQGRAAAVAQGVLHTDIVGVAVRLYKYLFNDYYDEFVFSVNEWVLKELTVVNADAADATGHTPHLPTGAPAQTG